MLATKEETRTKMKKETTNKDLKEKEAEQLQLGCQECLSRKLSVIYYTLQKQSTTLYLRCDTCGLLAPLDFHGKPVMSPPLPTPTKSIPTYT